MVSFLQPFLVFLACSVLLEPAVGFPKDQYYRNITSPTSKNQLSHRAGRYLFPFAIINFPPEPCSPTNSPQLEGVCLSRKRCSASGGESVGGCQQGVGTCCKFTRQCLPNKRAVTVTETVENLINSNMAGSCEFVIPKQPGICQVKLEFINVALQDPLSTGVNAGNCQSESLTVSGAANLNGPLKVCGRLTDQHMILSYGTTSDQISVIMHSEMISQNYNIRASQISCNSVDKAPDDCLQYFTTTTAVVKSFGFPTQLNNQRYTICVKPNSGGSSLLWTTCTSAESGTSNPFAVSEASTPCLTDWIAIDAEKRCGQMFDPLMTTDAGSHARVRVNFDENETGDDVFTIKLQTPGLCESIVYATGDTVYPGGPAVPLCGPPTVTSDTCQCRFYNAANASAQALSFTSVFPTVDGNCPKIPGYTSSTDPLVGGECKYYANIRVTDNMNTGFCLRYQGV
ncbi:unnamed protein product [Orchesella dallaii]|uniref:CUB domain-containing protein n=1 Tax=Orchesella dallaii TaxID=48710 RepID=A0ABP1RFQ7_9HEXA